MKVQTKVSELANALSIVAHTLDKKGASANLYLYANEQTGFLYLYSTNLVSETATKIPIGKDNIEDGEVLINPAKLSDGLSNLKPETAVSLTTDNGNLKVQAGRVKFSLATNVAVSDLSKKMRSIPAQTPPVAEIPVTELLTFAKRSSFCMPNDQTGQRAILSVLKVVVSDNNEMAYATDGTIAVRVASPKKQTKGTKDILLPATTVAPLIALSSRRKEGETIKIIAPEGINRIFFKFADGTYYGALTMSTQYPNLTPIMEASSKHSLKVATNDLKQSLGRASSFVSSAFTKRILDVSLGETITIKANGDDQLVDTIEAEYLGDKPEKPKRVGINIDQLFNIASGSKSEYLTIGHNVDSDHIVVTDQEGEEDEQILVKYVMTGAKLASA